MEREEAEEMLRNYLEAKTKRERKVKVSIKSEDGDEISIFENTISTVRDPERGWITEQQITGYRLSCSHMETAIEKVKECKGDGCENIVCSRCEYCSECNEEFRRKEKIRKVLNYFLPFLRKKEETDEDK